MQKTGLRGKFELNIQNYWRDTMNPFKASRTDVLVAFTLMVALFISAVLYLKPEPKVTHIMLPSSIEADNTHAFAQQLYEAKESDKFILHVNGYGGDISSGFMLLEAMKNTKAQVQVVIEGFAISMYAMLAESAKDVVVKDKAIIMFHTIQTQLGPIPLNSPYAKYFMASLSEAGLFSKEEICDMMAGKEFWLSGKEFKERKATPKPLDNVVCEVKPVTKVPFGILAPKKDIEYYIQI